MCFIYRLELAQLAFGLESGAADLLQRVQHHHRRGRFSGIPCLCGDDAGCQNWQASVIRTHLALICVRVLDTTACNFHKFLRLLLVESNELLVISLVSCNG